jgi:hypothetical protein
MAIGTHTECHGDFEALPLMEMIDVLKDAVEVLDRKLAVTVQVP